MTRTTFTGLLAYPITPLTPDDAPDLRALARLVAGAVAAGVDGVVVLASSGAGTSFSADERAAVVRAATEAADGAVPVHAAVTAPTTREVVAAARAAEGIGAAGLVLAPFAYLPLADAEVVALFEAVADASALPVCFYNRPLFNGYDLGPDVLAGLAATTTVAAVKDPASLPGRPDGRVDELRRAADVVVGLSGDVPLLAGAPPADAWHSGLAALAPREYVAARRARVAGDGLGDGGDGFAGGFGDGGDARLWLLDLARTLAATRPVSGMHALAGLLGIPTAPPRGPSLPAPPADVEALRSVVARRPGR